MLSTLRAAWRVGDLRRRLLFTFYMFLVFRLGVHVTVPGIDPAVIQQMFQEGTLFSLLDLFSGGALKAFSVFALGIGPYITSSIIVQLLTVVIPKWEQLAKEGEEGRRRLNQYTRYGTVVLALVQGFGIALGLRGAMLNPGFMSVFIVVWALTAGTAFLMWLGELITDRGIGNGISLIIFAGIVSGLPGGIGNVLTLLVARRITVLNVAILGVFGLLVIAAVVWVLEGERRIPVQYAKRVVGRRMYGGQSTHIPMKVNQAGVIPVIFSTSVLAFPATIAQFINHPVAQSIANALDARRPLYMVTNALLIIFFAYFYTAISFNPVEVANNMKKYGGFIPGLRPGRPTVEHLERVLTRLTLVGAIFLVTINALPNFMMRLTNVPGLAFGGTALLIVVGVALETMRQIEAHLLLRNYQGFMK